MATSVPLLAPISATVARLPRRDASNPSVAVPRLSVIIVNFCQWRNTDHLVQGLRQSRAMQTGDAEIVIIDNHSPPSPVLGQLRRTPGVSLRRFGRNRGFARAVNEGARLSRGQWFLLLNPDMSVTPGFLDQLLDYANRMESESPRTGIIGFHLRYADGTRQASCGPFPTIVNTLGGLLLPRRRRKCRTVTRRRQRVPWATGCCLLIRRECLEQLSGFDEDFFLYYEDVDFCRRARQQGWSVWYDPRLEVVHHSPLHLRRVVPPLRLMTRHALLTYSRKHWPLWQTSILSGVVWLEAWARQRWAERQQQSEMAQHYGELRAMVGDLIQGREDAARRRLRSAARALRSYAEEQDRLSADAPDAEYTNRADAVSPGG